MTSLTVREVDASPSISGVQILEFDSGTGLIVTDQTSGVARVALGSHYKHFTITGATNLIAQGGGDQITWVNDLLYGGTMSGIVGIGGTNQYGSQLSVFSTSTSRTAFAIDALSGQTANLMNIMVASSTKLVLAAGSNLGLGPTSPFARLSIAATSTATLDNQNLFAISTSTASATSTAFIIDANGKVGIGTSSPSQQLSILGSAYLTGGLGVGRATTTAGVIETTGVINVQGAGTSSFTNGIALAN